MIYEKNYMPLKNILKFKKEKKDIKIFKKREKRIFKQFKKKRNDWKNNKPNILIKVIRKVSKTSISSALPCPIMFWIKLGTIEIVYMN